MRRGGLELVGERAYVMDQGEIVVEVVALEARVVVAVVVGGEFVQGDPVAVGDEGAAEEALIV